MVDSFEGDSFGLYCGGAIGAGLSGGFAAFAGLGALYRLGLVAGARLETAGDPGGRADLRTVGAAGCSGRGDERLAAVVLFTISRIDARGICDHLHAYVHAQGAGNQISVGGF